MTNDRVAVNGGIRFLHCEARPIPHISMSELRNTLSMYDWGKILSVQQHKAYWSVTCQHGKVYTRGKDSWLAHRDNCALPQWFTYSLGMALADAISIPSEQADKLMYIQSMEEWLEEWR